MAALRRAAAAVVAVAALLALSSFGGGSGVGVAASGCQLVTSPVALSSPGDLSAHPLQRTEWWWYVGNLFTTADPPQHFGIEIAPVRWDPFGVCDWPNGGGDQLVTADLALADTQRNRYRWVKTWERASECLHTTADQNATQLFAGRAWAMVQDPDAPDVFYLSANATNAGAPVNSSTPSPTPWNWQLQLTLVQEFPGAVPMAFDGYERDGVTPAAHYDQPYLVVRDGWVQPDADAPRQPVTGTVWNQHMWYTPGTQSSPDESLGWDWDYVHLDNGVRCAFQHFRNLTNGAYWPAQSYANCFNLPPPFPAGAVTLRGSDFANVRSHEWRSTVSGYTYQIDVNITVPSLGLSVLLRPWIDDNESSITAFPMFYYEGTARVDGTFQGQPVTGTGMVEQVFPYQQPSSSAAHPLPPHLMDRVALSALRRRRVNPRGHARDLLHGRAAVPEHVRDLLRPSSPSSPSAKP